MRPNSQDVGLEAAIIERVRNSSLVECAGTDTWAMVGERSVAEKPDRKDWWSEEKCECRNE